MPSDVERNQDRVGQLRNLKERTALGDAYSTLLGQQTIQAFSAFTFEEAIDAQIERIEGKGTSRRPNLLERVDRVEQSTLQAINVLKKVPPEDFLEPDDATDVNTERG